MRVVITRQARRDQDNISRYTLERWGRAQLLSYVGGLLDALDAIAASPKVGRLVTGLPRVYRRYPYGSHFIFYTVNDDTIRIVRILHQRMDAERHLN